MIIEKTKIFFFNKLIVWFPDDSIIFIKEYQIIFLRQHNLKINKKYYIFNQRFKTSFINLNNDLDLIYKKFSQTTRYDIRQAEKNNININFYSNKDFNELDIFNKHMNYFYSKRSISNYFNIKKINNKDFILVKSSFENKWHSYGLFLYDNNRFRLLILINNYENIPNKILGYSSKYLLWNSIKYSKKLNLNIFDLGGLNDKNHKSTKGINKFKLSFGGYDVFEYNSLIVYNVFIRLFYKLYYLFK